MNSINHLVRIRIEGPNLGRVINTGLKEKIYLSNVRYVDETELLCQLNYVDYKRLKKLLGMGYRVTVIRENGLLPLLKALLNNKIAIMGVILFCGLVYAQSLFIEGVEVSGNKTIHQSEILAFLEDQGVSRGAYKYMNYDRLENLCYSHFERVVWVKIQCVGRCVKVDLAEGNKNYSKKLIREVDDKKPCDIIADKSGYIYDIKPYKGTAKVKKGDYVKKGQILVSGSVAMNSYAYGTKAENQKEYFVHADADVVIAKPRNISAYLERYNYDYETTGKTCSGLRISFLDKNLDFSHKGKAFAKAVTHENKLIDLTFPLPVSIYWKENSEVSVKASEKSPKELKKEANLLIYKWAKANLKENAEISKKSLNFIDKKNIIKVIIVLETIEKVGKEKEIILGN